MFLGIYDYTVILTYIAWEFPYLELPGLWRGILRLRFSVWHFPDCVICLTER